ncbi:hypothetical protein HanXRQr2_Chr09g0392231 [Helianthus annuus]|uniref:Uncharacterized protein n=1 Tax=Helianthus annuus TaxID=4232 RepID=A0A9K3N8M3_HELAN|nr:hypothetical protein HanXRQr2_Chr09g0392231 [Helianthus annuus]KAJ0893492.1 hypothetical protein HanPSC8_Chr09g0378211 [Helianthus annuus]
MQSIFNIRSAYGLTLCLSGLTRFHHLSLSTQSLSLSLYLSLFHRIADTPTTSSTL